MAQELKVAPKYQRLYFAIATLLPLFYVGVMLYDFEWSAVLMLVIIVLNSYQFIMRALGKNPLGVLAEAYLRLSPTRVTFKYMRKKPVQVLWQDVERLDVHLFRAELYLTNGQTTTIDLEGLTDDNLRKVKDWLHHQQQRMAA